MAKSLQTISLTDILPPNLLLDEKVKAAALSFDTKLTETVDEVKYCLHLPRLDELPETVLDLLAWQWHVDFYQPTDLDIDKKRELIKKSIAWHRMKGTPAAVEAVVSAAFEKSEVKEWFEYGGEPYHFKIITENVTTDVQELSSIKDAINTVKNTRSWLDAIEFLLHLADNIDFNESFDLLMQNQNQENYPWGEITYDGNYFFMSGVTCNGEIVYDGGRIFNAADGLKLPDKKIFFTGDYMMDGVIRFDTNHSNNLLYNSKEIEKFADLIIASEGMSDEYYAHDYFTGQNNFNGVESFGSDKTAVDSGGEIAVTIGNLFNGSTAYNAGTTRFFNHKYAYDGSVNFCLDNAKAPLFDGTYLADGTKRFVKGGEYFEVYRYTDQL